MAEVDNVMTEEIINNKEAKPVTDVSYIYDGSGIFDLVSVFQHVTRSYA